MRPERPNDLNIRALLTIATFGVAASVISACGGSASPAQPILGGGGRPTPTPHVTVTPTGGPSVTPSPTPPPSSGGSEAACVLTVPGTGKTYAFVPASSATDSQGYPDSLAEVTIATGTTIASHLRPIAPQQHAALQHAALPQHATRRWYSREYRGRLLHYAADPISPLIGLTPGPSECGADATLQNLYLISNGTIYPASPIVNVVNVSASAGMTQTGTFTTDATIGVSFSGGTFDITGVVWDPDDSSVLISSSTGYELYSSTGTKIKGVADSAGPAENFGYDAVTDIVWSPTYATAPASMSIVNMNSGNVYMFASPPPTLDVPDSGAVDLQTNVAISPEEGPGIVHVLNLGALTLAGSTFTAPETEFNLANVDPGVGTYVPASAVDSLAHIGFLSGEFGTIDFCAIQLPTTAGTTAPVVSDWVCANFPNTPDAQQFASPYDPHATSTFDLGTGHYGLMFNQQDSYVAVVDLNKLLAAPREASPYQNTVMPTYDLVANNVVFYIQI